MSNVIQTLVDKGFNGADIHYFLQRFDIRIIIPTSYFDNILFIHPDDTQEDIIKKRQELNSKAKAWREAQLEDNNKKWEAALIAANFEKPK